MFGTGKSELSVPVVSRLAVNTAEAAIAAAMLGVDLVRVLSYQVADAIRDQALSVVLPSQPISEHAGVVARRNLMRRKTGQMQHRPEPVTASKEMVASAGGGLITPTQI